MNNDPTHTYLDINIVNNSLASNTSPQPIVFQTGRNADYLSNPSNYYVSVIRWSLDNRLPIIIPQLILNQTFNADIGGYNTVYNITLQIVSGGITASSGAVPIIFKTQQTYLSPPTDAITSLNQTYDNPYFYIDSVQYFLELVNDAFTRAFDLVLLDWTAKAGGLPNPMVQQIRPFIQYNYDGNFTMYGVSDYLDKTGTAQIYMNSSLYTLFNGLSSVNLGFNTTTSKNVRIQMLDNGQSVVVNGITYGYMLTEYPCVPFWSPVSSIVFTSNGIPVEPTNTNPTNFFGNSPISDLGANSSSINLQPTITDFDINYETGTEGRQITYYAATGEYRFFDLNTNRPLNQINVQCYWKDKIIGSLHTMYLYSGGAATLKLLFRKKNYFSGKGY
jgi:hypothetical protein